MINFKQRILGTFLSCICIIATTVATQDYLVGTNENRIFIEIWQSYRTQTLLCYVFSLKSWNHFHSGMPPCFKRTNTLQNLPVKWILSRRKNPYPADCIRPTVGNNKIPFRIKKQQQKKESKIFLKKILLWTIFQAIHIFLLNICTIVYIFFKDNNYYNLKYGNILAFIFSVSE